MKRKVKINLPKAVEGMNVTGKINNRDGSMSAYDAFSPYDSQNVPSIQVNRTLKPTTRENANLEAEKGETVITDLTQGGIPEFYTIGGKRHYDGGTPLNLPPDSFIFSRDRKLKIKDKYILAQFGITKPKKGGYTPAEISKKYDINKYRKILADPTSDKYQKETAERMIENYNYKLGALAMIQESMKGFPNGIPAVAIPYITKSGFDPATIFPQGGQGQPQQMKYGGQNYFAPGGEFDKGVVADTSPYTKQMFANISTPQQALALMKGQRFASGETPSAEQALKMQEAIPVDQQYFDALKQYTGMEFKHSGDDQASTWEFQGYEPQQTTPKLSDKLFTPGFKYEDGKLYQKRQGRVTGEEHWEASNPLMASMYAKKYGTGDMSKADLRKQIQENPEAFASTWGQQAEDDAQLAAITLKKFGGDMPKYQYQGEVLPNESDYTSLYDANVYAQGIPELDQYSTMYDAMYNQPRQRVRINMPNQGQALYNEILKSKGTPKVGQTYDDWWTADGSTPGFAPNNTVWNGQAWVKPGSATPVTSNKSTRYQDIPKGKDVRKWDMTAEGYDEASVKPGDYIKKADGKWVKATGKTARDLPTYKGENLEKTFSNDSAVANKYAFLEQTFSDADVKEAFAAKVKEALKNEANYKDKTGKSVSKDKRMTEEEINALTPDDIVRSHLNMQRRNYAFVAKGIDPKDFSDSNGELKTNLSTEKKKKYKDLGITNISTAADIVGVPLGEQGADSKIGLEQASYIGFNDLLKNRENYSSELQDKLKPFKQATQWGTKDEPLGTISPIDRWYTDTSAGQLDLIDDEGEMGFEEVAWKEAKKDPAVNHLANTYRAQKTPFWTEDVMKLGFGLRNLFDIRKEQPWIARPDVVLPDPTFLSPTQQIQNILSAQQQGVQGAAAFGDPQAFVANTAALQANAMQKVANAIGTVQDKNVQIANQFEMQRANILNRSNEKRAMLATELYDRHKVLNQQYRNAKNQAWDSIQRNLVNAWTNRGKAQMVNEMSDNFRIDPRTGMISKTWDRSLYGKNANQPDISERYNNLMKTMPGVSPDVLARIAAKQSGISTSPTQFTGVDPNVLNMGYPAGTGGYYPPQG